MNLLQTDKEASVRARAAFALGEIESVTGAAALSEVLEKTNETNEVRARALEALGKIAAALPKSDEARSHAIGEIILKTLGDELNRSPKPNREVVLLGLTATLRARPTGASSVVAKFLSSTDARVRADAENTLARMRAKESTGQLRQLLASDPDPIVRANAAAGILGYLGTIAAVSAIILALPFLALVESGVSGWTRFILAILAVIPLRRLPASPGARRQPVQRCKNLLGQPLEQTRVTVHEQRVVVLVDENGIVDQQALVAQPSRGQRVTQRRR